jgi:deoxyribose-phosphate aldolase
VPLRARRGAHELDVVMPLWAAVSGDFETVDAELAAVLEASARAGAACKVILEIALLGNGSSRSCPCSIAAGPPSRRPGPVTPDR